MEQPNDVFEPEISEPSDTPARWSGLKVRAASAAVLATLVLGILWQGGFIFMLFVILAALIMMREWNGLVREDRPVERLLGMLYVAIPCASILWLRDVQLEGHSNPGLFITLFLIATVSATDIGAYFAGRQFGGPKLAPTISPNKTWAGLGGGALAAAIVGACTYAYNPFPMSFFGGFFLGVLLALLAQAGDLLESWMKRRADVKDSGTLLPGHGGLLDRVDGYIFTLPFYATLLWLSNVL
jgi:phosphatidate cytidylyltransferase